MSAEELTPFQRQFKDAEAKHKVTALAGSAKGVYVAAEAGTGSRYAVVVSPLPGGAWDKEGGRHLISLLQPWQANMVFTVDGSEIHADYLLEKLTSRDRIGRGMHGGDAAGIVLTVNRAVRAMAQCEDDELRQLDRLMGVQGK